MIQLKDLALFRQHAISTASAATPAAARPVPGAILPPAQPSAACQ
ncbi:hypothetical protein [Collimonas sp.]